MRSRVLVLVAAVVVCVACDDGGTALPVAPAASAAGPSTVLRGEYLVRSVAGCGECHTPRDAQGNLEMDRWLSGVANRFDLVPGDDSKGGISAPNLTPFALARFSDQEIERAFLDGVGLDGTPLFPVMPYYAYRNMSHDDADAIVAYLRNVPAIRNVVPARQPLPVSFDAPAPPVPEDAIPHTTLPPYDRRFAAAERGRYVAGEVGFCLDCHTPWRLGITPPLDLTRVFGGGRAFSARDWSVPSPAPAVVYSYDITPDATGISTWSPELVARALQHGKDDQGGSLCRPMPSGPWGGLGGLSDEDAYDVGVYLTTIPPIGGGDGIPTCPRN